MIEERIDSYIKNGFLPESKFGQNFLRDEKVISDIISLCDIRREDKVLEIGPGLGSLSVYLSDLTDDLTLIEIDKRLASFLEADEDVKAEVISSDYLKLTDYDADKFDVVVSNLPYYVMTDIMKKLFDECVNARKMVFMVEKDALARIMAPAGTKQYGPLAVLCSLYGEVKHEFDVPRNCFVPAPNTTSCVISLTRGNEAIPSGFVKFLNRAFAMRRKKLVNNIKEAGNFLEDLGLDPGIRAEQLTPSEFSALYNAIMLDADKG